MMDLTENAISMICNGKFEQGVPVVQVVQILELPFLINGAKSYIMLISDGKHLMQGRVFSSRCSFDPTKIEKGSIVKLSQYFLNQMNPNLKFISINELSVLIQCCDIIGDPEVFVQGGCGYDPQAWTSRMRTVEVRKTVSQIKNECLGTSEKPDWITVMATISCMKVDNFCYTACCKCGVKVTAHGDGKWWCNWCERSVADCDCEYRYILNFQIFDFTGATWVTAFQEIGEEIMGVSAKDLYYLKQNGEDEKLMDIRRRVLYTRYIFKLKVQRGKSTVVRAKKLKFPSSKRKLAEEDSIAVLPAKKAKKVGVDESGGTSRQP